MQTWTSCVATTQQQRPVTCHGIASQTQDGGTELPACSRSGAAALVWYWYVRPTVVNSVARGCRRSQSSSSHGDGRSWIGANSQPDTTGRWTHAWADREGRWNQMPAGAHERACDDDDEAAPKLTGFKQRKSELGRTALFYFNLFSCYSNIKHGKLVTL